MKKLLLSVIIATLCVSYSFAQGGGGKGYATTGVVELSGTADFSGTRVFSSNEYIDDYGVINFNLRPQVDFFIINGFHIGLAPNLGIHSEIFDDGTLTLITIGPVVSPGYCFRLTDMLFLDLAPAFGFHYITFTDSGDPVATGSDEMFLTFQMFTTLKIAVGHALVNVGLFQSFQYHTWDNPDGFDLFTMGLTIGFSVYF